MERPYAKEQKFIGLVWSGNPRERHPLLSLIDRKRSCSLTVFTPLFEVEGIQFYSLQKGKAAEDVRKMSGKLNLIDLTPEIEDFADTAALIANLDLVISVDTSVAHLAGALAKPVWLLSRYSGCWRWLESRKDSPWYPTMEIFRQESDGAWQEVISRIKERLMTLNRNRHNNDLS